MAGETNLAETSLTPFQAEPEAALSATGALALMAVVARGARGGAQFVIATHSPILLACPDARVYELDDDGLTERAYDDLDAVRVTRAFLEAPERSSGRRSRSAEVGEPARGRRAFGEYLRVRLALCLAVLLAGCGSSGTAQAPDPGPPLELDRPLDGTLYFVAFRERPGGGVAIEESVYRLGPGDARPVRLLDSAERVWHVSAWDDAVVVSAWGESGAFGPVGAVLLDPSGQDGTSIADDAHSPSVGPGGAVAYTGFVRRRTVSAALVRWTRKSRWRVVARRGIESHEWLPDGRLVLLQRRHGRPVIKVISRAGDRRSFRARGRPNRRLLVTRDGTIAFGGLEGRLQLFDARGRTRRVLKTTGWFVTGVAPRGDRFVLVERDGNRLAVREPSGEIRPIGRINPAYTIAVVEWEA